VLANGVVVGRIFRAAASPVGTPWMWTLTYGHHKGRSPTHGHEPTREAAMAAFAKSWRGGERHPAPAASSSAGPARLPGGREHREANAENPAPGGDTKGGARTLGGCRGAKLPEGGAL
jgi:hypothetical protein